MADCYLQDIHRILKSNREGQWVIALYNLNGELSSAGRDELAKRVILTELKADLETRLVPYINTTKLVESLYLFKTFQPNGFVLFFAG